MTLGEKKVPRFKFIHHFPSFEKSRKLYNIFRLEAFALTEKLSLSGLSTAVGGEFSAKMCNDYFYYFLPHSK